VQAQRVVPLVDLALCKGYDVDVTPRLALLVMDHLYKVELFVFLLVREAGALIHEFNLAALELDQLSLHVEVIEKGEGVLLESPKDIAHRLECVCHIFFVFLFFSHH